MSDASRLRLAGSGRIALVALGAIGIGVLVVPALSSRVPLLIQDVTAQARGICWVRTASDVTSSSA